MHLYFFMVENKSDLYVRVEVNNIATRNDSTVQYGHSTQFLNIFANHEMAVICKESNVRIRVLVKDYNAFTNNNYLMDRNVTLKTGVVNKFFLQKEEGLGFTLSENNTC